MEKNYNLPIVYKVNDEWKKYHSPVSQPLRERRDYGVCDQVERRMIDLSDQGLLDKETYEKNKERIDKCRKRLQLQNVVSNVLHDSIEFQEYKKPNIAIDFDGVIHQHNEWCDGKVNGEPIPGVVNALNLLKQYYKIIIFSARLHKGPFGESVDQYNKIYNYLISYGIYFDEISFVKPIAKYYIDDNAIRFNNWNDTLCLIDRFNKQAGIVSRKRRDRNPATKTQYDSSIDQKHYECSIESDCIKCAKVISRDPKTRSEAIKTILELKDKAEEIPGLRFRIRRVIENIKKEWNIK